MKIDKLLIANRGEIASRIIRTAHRMDIATVAVFSDADRDAAFVHEADEAVWLPGHAPTDTYLRGDLIIHAAKRTGATAIHPGYGFLSEQVVFAEQCAEAGIVFVGPPPEAIRAMGSKTSAKQLMSAAGVPVLPSVVVDDEQAADVLVARALSEVGFPVLVKAAFGGGGRGMRVVEDPEELADAVASARREAASAFGDGTVFLERFVDRPRHIEVQVFADAHENVVHLFERECSIQRRYQKIIEESPSPVVTPELRKQLGDAAVAAAQAIGYVGAGTVEFIMDASGAFYFLEVNTRLQVEHPVTEMVTGLDLVQLQLQVAEGALLPSDVLEASVQGHAIEARLYAEDVVAGYLPATGRLVRFEVPDLAGIRVDSGVRTGDEVSTHYDPMLAKVIAHAPTRDQAARLLARALAESSIHGVTTNRDLLVGILREPEFLTGDIDTGYLVRHDPKVLSASDPETVRLHALGVALADQAERRQGARVVSTLPSGWRNVHNAPLRTELIVGGEDVVVDYRLRGTAVDAVVDGVQAGEVIVYTCTPDRVDLLFDGVRRCIQVTRDGDARFADSPLGTTAFMEKDRFPLPGAQLVAGSLVAPMPGTVARIEVEVGAYVVAGDILVVLEAMKMEHAVRAPHAGHVEALPIRTGDSVDIGETLAVVSEETA